ncbi:MAG TPA: serine/threonine-protein kinase [Gemmataceae bacterium]|nr:serine/threonine-protein kinase [Gemmataceae bacterium]
MQSVPTIGFRLLWLLLFALAVFFVIGLIVEHHRRSRRARMRVNRPRRPRSRMFMADTGAQSLPRSVLPAPLAGQCPECGAALADDSPHGLCPRCLMRAALRTPPPETQTPQTSPYPVSFTAPEPGELAPHFPQLEILSLIGQGGMGAVYQARQLKLDRLVALKILPAEWGRDPAFAERFAREARALARLTHPNVVAVHDFGEAAGHFYLVMEFVDGLNLRQQLQDGPLAPAQALQVVSQICDALQYAHEEGIVHRDIKPENILLDRRGRVRIADFGLAKLVGPSRASFTLTGTHQVMGTLDYMAPEQRNRPQEVDHRADIYSLGVLFYEMLTGELPLGRFAAPSQVTDVDERIDRIVFRALEREPEQRYQQVREVKADLEGLGHLPALAGLQTCEVPAKVQLFVDGPATSLVAIGILDIVGAVALGVIGSMAYAQAANMRSLAGRPDTAAEGWLFVTPIGLGVLVLFAFAAVLLRGARNMRRFENYSQVVMALFVAIFPVPVLGAPAAVWCMWAMSRPEARAAFAANLQRRQSAARLSTNHPTPAPRRRGMRSFLYSLRNLFITSADSRAPYPPMPTTDIAANAPASGEQP